MRNGAMANSQTPERLRSDPPELGIRFLIQILGWILGFFFLKLGQSEIRSLLGDVILLCVFVGNKETEKSAHGHRLVFRVRRNQCQPQLASPKAQFVSISQQKNPLGPLGAKAGHWQERRGPGVTQQALKYTQLYTDMKST